MHEFGLPPFQRSSFCANVGCVEATLLADGSVAVRDSKNPSRRPLVYTGPEWTAFVLGVKAGEFDFAEAHTTS
jgi:Domain of unknown function (DUF397)